METHISLRIAFPDVLRNRSLLTLCLAVFTAYIGAGMVSTVRVLYVHSHGGSLAVISAMATAFLVANFLSQYPWGWLADRWGRRRVILVGLIANAIITAGYVLVSSSALFVGLRFLDGIAAASVLPAARAAIADLVPDESRGRAYGVFTACFNLGFLFGPAAGGLLAAVGYIWVFVVAVGLRLLGAAVVLWGLRDSLSAPKLREAGSGHAKLVTVALVAAYVLAFGDYLWLGFELTLAPLWMRHHLGASLPLIGITYSAWAIPGTLVAPIGGRLADRYRRSLLVLIGGLGQVPLYIFYSTLTSIYPVIGLFLVQSCLYSVVSPAVDAHLARSSPTRARGRAQSAFAAMGIVGAFVGATVFAPLYAIDYRLPLIFLGVGYGIFILVGGCLMYISERRGRSKDLETQSTGLASVAEI